MPLTPVDWDSLYARLVDARVREIISQQRYPSSYADGAIEAIKADAAIACAKDKAAMEVNQAFVEHTERVARLFTLLATETLSSKREIAELEARVFLVEP